MVCRNSAKGLVVVLFWGLLFWSAIPAYAGSPSLLTWGSFQYFWNTNALPGVELKDSLKVEEGYMVDLGLSVSFIAHTRRSMVESIRIQYRAVPGQEAGGPRFLKCIETAIRVGAFGWPQERIAAVRKSFEFMTTQPKIYQWQNSRFSRMQDSSETWIFTLEFVADDGE